LKIETQILETHQAKLTVQVEPERLESAKHRAARKIAGRAKIPGFRPGKAPYNVVEHFAGPGAILEDAVESLTDEIYPEALKEAGIKPYGPGALEDMPSMEPPTFIFLVPLAAETTLGDYRALRLPYDLKAIAEQEIDKFINDLRDRQAVLEPVERPAQEGDQVSVHLSAKRKQPAEGENEMLIQERPQVFTIDAADAENSEEWPFPGFSRVLIGLAKGAEKNLDYTFAEDSAFEGLRGKAAEFHLVVDEIKSRTLPELNDDFAKQLGPYETLDAVRAEIRTGMEQRAKSEYETSYSDQIIDQLIESSAIKYPPEMLEHETDDFIHDMEHRLAQQNLELETYLKMRKMDKDGLRKEIEPAATKRLKRSLILLEVAKTEKIEVEEQELQTRTNQTLHELSHMVSPKEAKRLNSKAFVSNLASSIATDLLIEKTLAKLRTYAKGEAPATEAAPDAATEEPAAPKKKRSKSAKPAEPEAPAAPKKKRAKSEKPAADEPAGS
jgi:trigger factor